MVDFYSQTDILADSLYIGFWKEAPNFATVPTIPSATCRDILMRS